MRVAELNYRNFLRERWKKSNTRSPPAGARLRFLELPIRHDGQDRIDYDNVETFRWGQVEQVKPLERDPSKVRVAPAYLEGRFRELTANKLQVGQGAAKVKQIPVEQPIVRYFRPQIGEIK